MSLAPNLIALIRTPLTILMIGPPISSVSSEVWFSTTSASEATTGSTLKPVINLISSMTTILLGSTIASVNFGPTRLMGMIKYFLEILGGINLTTLGLISIFESFTEGTRYWALKKERSSSSLI